MAPMPRCWDGSACTKHWCRFVHPHEAGYENAPMSREHKAKISRDSGSVDSSRDGGWNSRGYSKYDSGRRSSRESSVKDQVSPGPTSTRHGNGGRVSPGPPAGGWASPAPARGGWGSPASGWAQGSASPAPGGWVEPEPSSRRSSGQFGEATPSNKPPPSSPRRGRSPPRSKERRAELGQDQDWDSGRGNQSPQRQSRDKRSGSFGDAMDVDPQPPSATFPKSKGDPRAANQTPTSAASSMPPPPLPLGSLAQPLGAAPAKQAPLPPKPIIISLKPVAIPPKPVTIPPKPVTIPSQPATTSASSTPTVNAAMVTTPSTAAPTTATPTTTASAIDLLPVLAPTPPAPSTTVSQPSPKPGAPVPSEQRQPVLSVEVVQAHEWVALLDVLLQQRRKHQHLTQRIKALEELEKHRTKHNPNLESEGNPASMLASTRTEIAQLQESVEALSGRFAASMKTMQITPAPTSAGKNSGGTPVTSSIPALPTIDPVSTAQILSLENALSKMQSELKLVEAEVASVSVLSKECARLKEDIQGAKEGTRKAVGDQAKEMGETKKESAAIKTLVDGLKVELEGMKMDVTNAYRSLGDGKQETIKVKAQQDVIRVALEKMEQGAQKGRAGTSVDLEKRLDNLKGQVEQFGGMAAESRREIERLKKDKAGRSDKDKDKNKEKDKGKREREVSAPTPTGDGMDVDDPRPVKRVRLSLPPKDEATALPTLAQGTGDQSYADVRELYDRLEDYMGMLENEMVQHHADTREQLEEFAERVGLEPLVYSGESDVESVVGAGRAESAPPATTASGPGAAGKMRASAPPVASLERGRIAEPKLSTVQEDEPGEITGTEEHSMLRTDLDGVMKQLMELVKGRGLWPGIIGKNLAVASGRDSLEQVWEQAAGRTPSPTKQINGTNTHKDSEPPEMIALVKSMQAEQAKMAQKMAEMETKSARVEAENEAMRVQVGNQQKELREASLRSILDDALKPENSENQVTDQAVRVQATAAQQEMESIRQLAMVLPSLIRMADIPTQT